MTTQTGHFLCENSPSAFLFYNVSGSEVNVAEGSLYYEHRNEHTCFKPFGNVSRARAQNRQEYYTTLLEKRRAMVVRIAYFEGLP